MNLTLLIALSLLTFSTAFSQKERQLLRKGNEAFEKEEYDKAHELYTKSVDVAPSFGKARFNLGNAEYKKGDPMAAAKQFEMAAADAIDKGEKAKAYYNEANCYLNSGLYLKHNPPQAQEGEEPPPNPQDFFKKSIIGYKNALRQDPTDEESRYNLAYAQSLIEEQQGGGEGQDQQQQQDQEQQENEDQENKDQEKKDGEQDEQQEQKPDKGDEKNDEQEQQQPKPGEMTKKEAEQMLKALEQQEKELQGRKGLERIEGEKIEIDKDW